MRRLWAGLALLVSMLAAAPAQAEWRRAVSTHFIIYSEASDADLRAVAERLERFDGLMRRLTPVSEDGTAQRLTIYMPRTASAVAGLLGLRGAAGFYSADLAGPYVVTPRQELNPFFTADTILFHEYTHHFMLRYFSTAYPSWFVEGYAELFSTTRFERDGSIVLGGFAAHRAGSLRGTPPSLRSIMFRGRGEVPRWDFYATAWALTHYLLISDERTGQLYRYLNLVAGGQAPEQAAEQAFGGIGALERDFRRYLRQPRVPTLIIRFEQAPLPGPISIETLSPGAENLLWQQVEYRREPRDRQLDSLVRRVRSRAAATSDDPDALQLLADVEALAGNLEAADRAADALLALRPTAPRALLRKGLIEVARLERERVTDAARWTAAREWLRRANAAGPDNAQTLFEYYRAFERQGLRPPPPAVAALERAYELLPQSFDLRQRFARELIRARRYSFAVNVLSPVAYSAHGGWRGRHAQRTIELIRGLAENGDPPAEALTLPTAPPPDSD